MSALKEIAMGILSIILLMLLLMLFLYMTTAWLASRGIN